MARKLNTKFLVVLGGVSIGVAGVVGTYYLAYPQLVRVYHVMTGQTTEKLEEQGDAALAAGDYQEAVEQYGRAAGRERTNIGLQVKYVDAFDYTVQGDNEKFRRLHELYMSILQTDNTNIDVLERLMRIQLARLQGAPTDRPNVNTLKQTTERILRLKPDHREARKARVAATLEPYTRDLEVPADEVEQQRQAARALFESDPKDGEALMLLLRFNLRDVDVARRNRDEAGADQAVQACETLIDEALKIDPQNAVAYFAKWQITRLRAAFIDPSKTSERIKLVNESQDYLAKADEFAKPPVGEDDEQFLSIRALYLRELESRDPKKAEERYRQLIVELPNDRRPRTMLAAFLARQPARREDAAKVLEAPFTPNHPLRGMESLQQRQLGFLENARLAIIRLANLESITDHDVRKKEIDSIEATLKQLSSTPEAVNSIPIWLLRIEAGLAMARDDLNTAVTKLDSVLARIPADVQGPDGEVRSEVLLDLSQAYLRLGQTGSARPLLRELVQRRPDHIQGRVKLSELLIAEQRYDEAKEQVDFLLKYLPGNPVVERLNVRLQSLRPGNLREQYAMYPEETRDQRVVKLTAAGALGDNDEVTRLAKLMLASDAGDIEAAVVYVQQLVRADQKDAANVALADALKAKPDDPRLKSLRDMLTVTSADELRALQAAQVEKIAEPYEREIARAEFLARENKADAALAALRKAQSINPDETRAYEGEFNLLIAQARYDEAGKVVDQLARLNADQTFGELTRNRLNIARTTTAKTPEDRARQLNEALDESTRNVQKYPQIAATGLLRAQLLQQLSRFEEAAEQYNQVLTRTPTNVEALRGSIQSLLAVGRNAEAKRQLDDARRLAPNDAALRQLELAYNMNFGDPQQAVGALQEALKQNPQSPQAWGQLGAAYEQIAANLAQKADAAGEKKYLEQASNLYRDAAAKFTTDLRFATLHAGIQRRLGNADEAEKIFERLVAQDTWKDKPEAFQLLAEQYVRSQKPERAEEVLIDLINRTKPVPTPAVLQLSRLYTQQNRLQDALTILDLNKDEPAVVRQRIELLVGTNQLPAAREVIEQALAGGTPGPDLYVTAAIVELRSGDVEKADGFLANALRERPDDPAALYYRAQVRLGRNPQQVAEARADLDRVLELSPNNIEARLILANVLLQQQERDAAIDQLQRAWAVNRSSKPALLQLANLLLEARRNRDIERLIAEAKENPLLAGDQDVILADANVTLAAGDRTKAVELARKSLNIDRDNPTLRDRCFDLFLRAKAYRDLIQESDAVVKDTPDAWPVRRQRGIAFSSLKQTAEAEGELSAAFDTVAKQQNVGAIRLVADTIARELGVNAATAKLEPVVGTDPSLRLVLAGIYQVNGNITAAVEQYERMLADRSRLSADQLKTTLNALGGAYLQLTPAAFDKARKVYEELLVLAPDDILLLNNLAYVLTQPESGGKPSDALQYSQKAYDLSLKRPQTEQTFYIWDTHGWTLILNNRRPEGLDLLRKTALSARFPEVHLHLAEALMMSGDLDGAALSLDEARSILEGIERDKRPVDSSIRLKFDQLSADLAAKRKEAVGLAR